MEVPIYYKNKVFGYAIMDKVDVIRLGDSRITPALGTSTYIYLHVFVNGSRFNLSHFIAGHPPEGFLKDHINRNPFDNRNCNLKDSTHSQNSQNKPKKENCSSEFIGVCYDKESENWRVTIKYEETKNLVSFDDEEEAARMYDKFALQIHGINANTNNLLTIQEIQLVLDSPLIFPPKKRSVLGKTSQNMEINFDVIG
jgi:hypothetical protein